MAQATSGVMSASARLLRQAPGSAYIHIPFCRSKCFYCDFAVTPIGTRSSAAADSLKTNYVGSVLNEIAATAAAAAERCSSIGSESGKGLPRLKTV